MANISLFSRRAISRQNARLVKMPFCKSCVFLGVFPNFDIYLHFALDNCKRIYYNQVCFTD
jgi:hypothetical protein